MSEIDRQTKTDANFTETHRFAEGNTMGKGRILGSKNKFTQIKQEIAEIWDDAGLKAELLAQLLKDKSYSRKFVKEVIIPILPKDALIDQSSTTIIQIFKNHDPNDRTNDPQVVLQQEAD